MKKILRQDRNSMTAAEVRQSGLLIDGRDYYLAFYRAALKARRYILIAGWQFDSNVLLVRGDDASEEYGELRFLPFLNQLCDNNPELEIYLLAWDFNIVFATDRELLQEWVFKWNSSNRIHFKFDSRHAVGASHHQKFVVIDGMVGFVGGMDICSNRWDDRRHLPANPLRCNDAGEIYEQYHDIQSYHTGPLVRTLEEFFKKRWHHAGASRLSLPEVEGDVEIDFTPTLPIKADRAALSRTQSRTLSPPQEMIQEIRSLYMDAIEAADELIYIENQYFSSQAVYNAMKERMEDKERPTLRIVMILPKEPHSLLENVSLGIAQAKMLRSLKECASRNGHDLGVYFTASETGDGTPSATYIHAKLLIVDDRFMTVGSANTNNRSMGLDTELNISWEADAGQDELIGSIRRARINLLSEHCGIGQEEGTGKLTAVEPLVEILNSLADDTSSRLRHHTMEGFIENLKLLENFNPEELAIDPERPIIEENIYDLFPEGKTGFFTGGISWLDDHMVAVSGKWREASSAGTDDQFKKGSRIKDIFHGSGQFIITKWYIFVFLLLAAVIAFWLMR